MGVYESKLDGDEIEENFKERLEKIKDHPPIQALDISRNNEVEKVWVYCDLCYPKFDFVEAVKFCQICNRYLCKICYDHHKHASSETDSTSCLTVESIIHEKELDPEDKDDEEDCWISGMTLLSTGDLVVVDGNNCMVKIIRVNDSVIMSKIKLHSEPFDVAEVSKYEIAVTLPEKQQIQYLGALNGLSKTRRMRVDGHCFGISHKNNLIAVTFLCPEKIEIISDEGKIFQRIEKDLKGEGLFSAPYYIAFCHEGKYVYVSDHRKDAIIKVTIGGRITATYRAGDLDRPEALAVHEDGSVIMASRDNNSLHFISSSCRKIRLLKGEKYKLERPWALCYSTDNRHLFVGNDDGKCINVYALQNSSGQVTDEANLTVV